MSITNPVSNLKEVIYQTLSQDKRLWTVDNELNQTLLIHLLEKTDARVVELLFQQQELRNKFFLKLKTTYVFKINEFRFFMEESKVDNSYTAYKNRIGLTAGKRFIKDSEDIVLSFPYKDCVLQGGQSTEEGMDTYFAYEEEKEKIVQGEKIIEPADYKKKQAKRKEIFFNEVLAQDEKDRLFDEKALVGWKRYTTQGEEEVQKLTRDENGTLRENMIIKGNNLLALHSLKRQFAGKVKLIYIDPPYNTKTNANTFSYNNNFNHSTWLTFMKNRLEVAKSLLKDDGIFVISIDHYELFYLGILADQIFGRENRLGIIAAIHNPGGRQDDKFFPTAHENIIFYAKDLNSVNLFKLGLSEDKLKQFKLKDKYGRFKLRSFRRSGNNSNRKDGPGLYYPIYYSPENNLVSLEKRKNYIEILPIDDKGFEKCWRWGKSTFQRKMEKYITVKEIKGKYDIYVKERECDYEGEKAKTIWNNSKYTGQTGTQSIKTLFGEKIFTYPKSPYIMKDILKITTKSNDIILDYHAGSGTTAHAVLKLNKEDGGNRKYILVEQMDYINTVTCPRIQKVMEQEEIKDSFIYFELAEWNEKAKKIIQEAKSLERLKSFFHEMCDKYFLHYNLKVKDFTEKIIHEEAFQALSLAKQKSMFLTMLDLNQMYVCQSEMNDPKFAITSKEQNLTKAFYE